MRHDRDSRGAANCLSIVLMTLATVALPPRAAAEVIDRVVAIVGNQLILASDIEAARTFGLIGIEGRTGSEKETLSRLVDRALILAEVNRYAPPEPEDRSIAAEVDAVRARFPDERAYEAALLRVGLQESSLREWVRQDLRMVAYLEQRFIVTPPTDEEVAEAYRRGYAESGTGGAAIVLEDAAPAIVRAIVEERRAVRVEEWLVGLRRRAQVTSLP